MLRQIAEAYGPGLTRAFIEEHFHPGDIVVRRGQRADGWRIVRSGKARIVEPSQAADVPPVIGPGNTFGDRSLLEEIDWPYTLRAESPLSVITLRPDAFAALQRQVGPAAAAELARRVQQNVEFEFLQRVRAFAELSVDRLESLLDAASRITFVRGSHVFSEDDPAECCYLVRTGRIHLLKAVGQSQKQIAVRRDGDLIGEIELLYGTPRLATAVASTDVELLVFSQSVFDRCLPEGPTRQAIFQVATERLLQYQNMLSEGDGPAEPWRIPSLVVEHVRVAGRFSRTYPVVRSEPDVAGLACLAMIDAFQRRESRWHERLETLLWDRRAQSLHLFSRTAEACGYFTRLITLRRTELTSADLPGVIEDDDGSLAVVFEARRQITIGNPARGIRRADTSDFDAWWNGRILSISAPLPDRPTLPIAPHVGAVASIAFASLLTILFSLAGPLASKTIVDRVLVNDDVSLLTLLAIAMAAVLGFQLVATVLREYLLSHVRQRMAFSLQQRFLHRILHLPQRVLITRPVASLAMRFRDNDWLVRSSSAAASTVVVDGLAVVLYFAALWAISRPAAGIAGVFVAAYAAVSLIASPIRRAAGRRGHEARAALQAHLLETVAGIQTIKSLLVESTFFERGRKLMMRVKAADFAASQVAFTTELIGTSLHVAAVVAIFAYVARLAAAGHATTGDMVASLGIFGATLAPLTALLDVRTNVRDARQARAGVADMASLETETDSHAGVPPPIEGHTVFSHVTFRYPGQDSDALSDISLEILPGQTVAIVGRSGSGKTTLMNLLMGLYAPSSGNIYVDHIDIQSIPRAAYRRQLGVVEQQPFLFDGTVRENIAKADPAIPFEDVVDAAKTAGIHDFIVSLAFGYDTKIGERGTALSGGEKQRLMIARAAVAKPRLLILDEATSAVDSGSERQIQQNIRRATDGRTTFVIAHRLSTVRTADRIVVLDRGRIVETGTHAELMTAKRLYYYLTTRTV